jgi:hypothetical protein
MKNRLMTALLGFIIASTPNAIVPNSAQAQVKEQRNPGRAFQRMSKYKTYDECLSANLKLSGVRAIPNNAPKDQRRCRGDDELARL